MEKCDAIIVGAVIAGLGVGGILQDKGLKTAVFEKIKGAGLIARRTARSGRPADQSGRRRPYIPARPFLSVVDGDLPWLR